MLEKPASFTALLNLWPRAYLLAEDIGVTLGQVYTWRCKCAKGGSVPPRYWDKIAAALKSHHGIEMTRADFYALSHNTQARDAA